ncbi:MAG: polyphosphate polymerase domain-containing protein [Candidatus Delongbacteria bacterium]|jgi:hypothetical protein|nr:polyphosphate polymerase domain-containing protein [Candidatus Delongbacteria bacterium]
MQTIPDLSNFNPISLKGINSISLMKRFDTKYVFHKNKLPDVLDFLKKHYSILEMGNKRFFRYENIYLDTDEHQFYISHHNKKKNRHKVRVRKYLESQDCFLEVKFKNNKDRTIKKRIQIEESKMTGDFILGNKDFVENHLPREVCPIEKLYPSIHINFNRFTLANVSNKERLTFDVGLEYYDSNSDIKVIDDLVIAELKQEMVSRNSPVVEFFKNQNIRPAKFSKYCTGMLLIKDDIKYNRFKTRLNELEKYIA